MYEIAAFVSRNCHKKNSSMARVVSPIKIDDSGDPNGLKEVKPQKLSIARAKPASRYPE